MTVLIRAYNRRDKTLRAVRSALRQTLSDQPIIVVDDASTDGTPEAIEDAFRDRVKVVGRTENGGPGAAANTGLAAVETPFVAFLDSDDEWHPLFLERMVEALRKAPDKSLAYCDYRRRFEDHGIDVPMKCGEPEQLIGISGALLHSMSVVVCRTRGLRALKGFREDLRIGEDQDLAFRLWLRTPNAFSHVRERLVVYSFGQQDSITTDYDRFLRDTTRLVDDRLAQPVLRDLRQRRQEMIQRRFLAIAERRHIASWVRMQPRRNVSLLILGAQDGDAVRQSLTSAAQQRQPPLEAVVVSPSRDLLNAIESETWPFAIHPLSLANQPDARQALALALAACRGELIAFLEAGDTWTADALDRHRRAFSSTLDSVCFSYGPTANGTPLVQLAAEPQKLIYQMLCHNCPGTLSTVTIPRKQLLALTDLPSVNEAPLWLGLLLRLILQHPGNPIALCQPVLAHGNRAAIDYANTLAVLKTLTETESGRQLSGLCDAGHDDLEAGRLPFSEKLDGPEGFLPIW